MKIPKNLKILGHNVEIVRVKNLEMTNGTNAIGACYFTENRIWVDTCAPEQQQEATLIHEIIEFIDRAMEIKLEHKQISCLESGLYQVLKDNHLLR